MLFSTLTLWLFLGVRIGFAGPSTYIYSISLPRLAHLLAFGSKSHPWNRKRVPSGGICSLGLVSSKTSESSKEYMTLVMPLHLLSMFLSVLTCLFLILIFGCAGSSLCRLSLVAVQRFLLAVASPVAEQRP